MKKNKGFTLVELLAVIAILAILVIIALPNVMGMFNDAKKSSFTTELKNVYKVAQQQWMMDSMTSTGDQVYSRCKTCTGKSLNLSGRSELDYYIKIDKSGKVTNFYATDGTYQFSYYGDLLATQINDVEEVAKLGEDDVLNIANNDAFFGSNSGCKYRIITEKGSFSKTSDVKEICFDFVNDGYTYNYNYSEFVSARRTSESDQLVININSENLKQNSYIRVYRDSSKTELLTEVTYNDRPKFDRYYFRNNYFHKIDTNFIKPISAKEPSDVYIETSDDFCRNNTGCDSSKSGYEFGYSLGPIQTVTYSGPWLTDYSVIEALNNVADSIDNNEYGFNGIENCSNLATDINSQEIKPPYNYSNCRNNTYFVKYFSKIDMPK